MSKEAVKGVLIDPLSKETPSHLKYVVGPINRTPQNLETCSVYILDANQVVFYATIIELNHLTRYFNPSYYQLSETITKKRRYNLLTNLVKRNTTYDEDGIETYTPSLRELYDEALAFGLIHGSPQFNDLIQKKILQNARRITPNSTPLTPDIVKTISQHHKFL